jgi:hypothetical protein
LLRLEHVPALERLRLQIGNGRSVHQANPVSWTQIGRSHLLASQLNIKRTGPHFTGTMIFHPLPYGP